MKRCFARLSYLWILIAMPLAASTVRIYVANGGGDTVDVIDPATNKVVQTIEGIEGPRNFDFSPDGSQAYITESADKVVEVVDTKTGKKIKKVPLSGTPNNLAVTKDGKRIFVCIADDPPLAGLDIIDTTSLERVKTIPMKAWMHNIYMTPDGKYAVAGSPLGKFLIVIDLQTEQPAWEITLDRGVQTMAIETNPDRSTHRIFVNLHDSIRIKLPGEPSGYGEPDGPGASHGIGVAPDGKTLWVNSVPANSVFVYSLPELKLLGHVPLPELNLPGKAPVGGHPDWLTFTPDGKTIYVCSPGLNLVSAIDVKTLKEVARIPVGDFPSRLATLVLP
jgi:YVTN family beta-propeller protein